MLAISPDGVDLAAYEVTFSVMLPRREGRPKVYIVPGSALFVGSKIGRRFVSLDSGANVPLLVREIEV